jgi:hypothetical protein
VNLNSIVRPIISAVNPQIIVDIRISTGNITQSNGSRVPGYATPGAITGTITGTTLTVSAIAAGTTLQPGQVLSGASPLIPGTGITGQLSGPEGGLGTYSLTRAQEVPAQAMATALLVSAQMQPMSAGDLRQIEGLNLTGEKQVIYVNGDVNGIIRVMLKGGDLVTLPNGSVWLVTNSLEGWAPTAGWTKFLMILQNGS